jgi:hypothetical protein
MTEQNKPETDHYASCNGCGVGMTENEIKYTSDDGSDYCNDCYDAIQSDDESSGRLDTPAYSYTQCIDMLESLRQRCAEENRVIYHNGHTKADIELTYFQSGADNIKPCNDRINAIDIKEFVTK